jgi:hypothetical protein
MSLNRDGPGVNSSGVHPEVAPAERSSGLDVLPHTALDHAASGALVDTELPGQCPLRPAAWILLRQMLGTCVQPSHLPDGVIGELGTAVEYPPGLGAEFPVVPESLLEPAPDHGPVLFGKHGLRYA